MLRRHQRPTPRLLPAGATVAGGDIFLPLDQRALFTAHAISGLVPVVTWMMGVSCVTSERPVEKARAKVHPAWPFPIRASSLSIDVDDPSRRAAGPAEEMSRGWGRDVAVGQGRIRCRDKANYDRKQDQELSHEAQKYKPR